MPFVTSVETNRGLVEIHTDGRFEVRFPKKYFALCPLTINDEVDPEVYISRLAAAQFSDAYEAALTSLDRSDRTAKQISDYLRRKCFVPPVITAVVEKLTQNGLIDDARYASRMAETISMKSKGVFALKRSMKAKGLSDENIEAALSGFDDAQQAAAALGAGRILLKRYDGLPACQKRAKLSQALGRRGFPWNAIEHAIEQLSDEGFGDDDDM